MYVVPFLFLQSTSQLILILASYIKPNDRRHPRPAFPKVKPHAPDTLQTPSRSNLTFIGKIKQAIWLASKRFSERDLKYAVKVGVSAAMLAAPAFFDSTRTIFVQNWGDWALISVRALTEGKR